ncbi:hypothetical protein EVAR_55939_1 [Eumeta japonica]|uniref:Uncharacterized protein n=1 Tax=Eumeta variegata TaxID=151549 RepID=A0A4C1YUE0_EUMVA|nr:hypothetical protein EVAR_55939_1 [Eumeta japonica]
MLYVEGKPLVLLEEAKTNHCQGDYELFLSTPSRVVVWKLIIEWRKKSRAKNARSSAGRAGRGAEAFHFIVNLERRDYYVTQQIASFPAEYKTFLFHQRNSRKSLLSSPALAPLSRI